MFDPPSWLFVIGSLTRMSVFDPPPGLSVFDPPPWLFVFGTLPGLFRFGFQCGWFPNDCGLPPNLAGNEIEETLGKGVLDMIRAGNFICSLGYLRTNYTAEVDKKNIYTRNAFYMATDQSHSTSPRWVMPIYVGILPLLLGDFAGSSI